jgi:hypothetical protein
MRNPFRRRRKLHGATGEWNEAEHVPIGDEYVAIPTEQLPAEAVERLRGVKLYQVPDQGGHGHAILVNVDAVEAEVDEWIDNWSRESAERALAGEDPPDEPDESEMRAVMEAAFNNPDHWVRGEVDEMAEPGTRYSMMRIDLLTGRIGGSDPDEEAIDQAWDEAHAVEQDEVLECPECGREFADVNAYSQHFRAKH